MIATDNNVLAPISGYPTAAGDGITNDTAAIQARIDAAFSGALRSRVIIPSGRYLAPGLVVPAGVRLEGDGPWTTNLFTNTDESVVSFTSYIGGNHDGGLSGIAVNGYYNAAATKSAVVIGEGSNAYIRDARMLYGKFGLDNNGVDSRICDSFVWGYSGAIRSTGANWYRNVKADQPGAAGSFCGLYITTTIPSLPSVAENHFTDCDFSGNGYSYSIYIDDGTSTKAITDFKGTVFSSAIVVVNAKSTMFGGGCEFGSTTLYANSGFISVVGSYAYAPTTVTGAAARRLAGNSNIS